MNQPIRRELRGWAADTLLGWALRLDPHRFFQGNNRSRHWLPQLFQSLEAAGAWTNKGKHPAGTQIICPSFEHGRKASAVSVWEMATGRSVVPHIDFAPNGNVALTFADPVGADSYLVAVYGPTEGDA